MSSDDDLPPGDGGLEWQPTEPSAEPTEVAGELAQWRQRAVAGVLDWLLVSVPVAFVMLTTGLTEISTEAGRLQAGTGGVGLLVSGLAPVAYSAILEGSLRGQSLGKMAMSIRVADASTGGSIGPGRAALRRLVWVALLWICFIPGLVNALSPLWDRRRQAWHDKAVASLVVKVAR